MRRSVLLALAAWSSSLPVMAADLPVRSAPLPEVPPAFTWTSVYFGASAGYASLNGSRTPSQCQNPQGVLNGLGCGGTPFPPGPVFIASSASPPTAPGLPNRADGAIAGGRVGFDVQLAGTGLVLGAEAEASYAGLKSMASRSGAVLTPFANGSVLLGSGTFSATERLDYLATVRGRVGYAFDRFLVFGTGGLAFGQTTLGAVTSFSRVAYDTAESGTQVGWAAGGGVEYAIPDSAILHLSPTDSVTVTLAADYTISATRSSSDRRWRRGRASLPAHASARKASWPAPA